MQGQSATAASEETPTETSYYYTYEDIAKKWLAYLIWKKVPRDYANSFLKQDSLIRGSKHAGGTDVWSGAHVFYEGTGSSNGIKALYFPHSDVEALVDLIMAAYPELDRAVLLPNPAKRIPSTSFSSVRPVTFKTVEALQAGRQGMKLTHNVNMLAQNRLKMKQFQEEAKGAILAIDVESWEHNHDKLTEIGYAYIRWSENEPDGQLKEERACEHLIIEENMDYRNGQYSPDNRDRFNFGRSSFLSLREAVQRLKQLIVEFTSTSPLILVFHNASAEIEYFGTLGIDTKSWLSGFPAVSQEVEPEKALNVELTDGAVYIMDTQKLYGASGMEGARAQIGLKNALDALGIPSRYMHNAGNDACYTLAIYEALAGSGSIRAELIADEEARRKEQKKHTNANGWTSGWD